MRLHEPAGGGGDGETENIPEDGTEHPPAEGPEAAIYRAADLLRANERLYIDQADGGLRVRGRETDPGAGAELAALLFGDKALRDWLLIIGCSRVDAVVVKEML